MSETVASPASAAGLRVSRTGVLVTVLLVLVLGGGAFLVTQKMSELNGRVRDLSAQLEHARSASVAEAQAVDKALSPLVGEYVAAAQARLDAGDEEGARAELKHAQALATPMKDLGTGTPPQAMVAALTSVESALGEAPTLPPAPAGAT